MYVVFLAGGIASGKSTVARRLVARGAWDCDLDALSRAALAPGSPAVPDVTREFGADLLDPETGELDRALLAERAFADAGAAARLEAIELPVIECMLARELADAAGSDPAPVVAVVEVPLLDRAGGMLPLADEVVGVVCRPLSRRRARAALRGMGPADFDARAANQPPDEYVVAHSDFVLENDGDEAALVRACDLWWDERERSGWRVRERRGRGE